MHVDEVAFTRVSLIFIAESLRVWCLRCLAQCVGVQQWADCLLVDLPNTLSNSVRTEWSLLLYAVSWFKLRCQSQDFLNRKKIKSRSQWPRGLKLRSPEIPPGAWMSVCCECCVLSGRGLCDELITRPEESYRVWCVVVCDLETSWMSRPSPSGGCCAKKKFYVRGTNFLPNFKGNEFYLSGQLSDDLAVAWFHF